LRSSTPPASAARYRCPTAISTRANPASRRATLANDAREIGRQQPSARTPALDICPVTGHARLSYRRAAEQFETLTRPLADPGTTAPAELQVRGGWTLHQLRHFVPALTHEAEDGTNTPTLLALSRHASALCS
jgi:hypothetical protein